MTLVTSTKKKRRSLHDDDNDSNSDSARLLRKARVQSHSLLRSHPFNIKPIGNRYLPDAADDCIYPGLGVLFRLFPTDESRLNFLSYLSPMVLGSSISSVSKALYVYSHDDSIWRPAVLREFGGNFNYFHSWRSSFAYESLCRSKGEAEAKEFSSLISSTTPISISGFYSDTLFQSFYCSSIDLSCFNNSDTIDRISIHTLTPSQFLSHYGIPNRPLVITDIVNTWPAYNTWTTKNFLSLYSHEPLLKVGGQQMSFQSYLQYASNCTDESPLYLFDSAFGEKIPSLTQDYTVPTMFSNDLFSLLETIPAPVGYNDGCEDRDEPGAMRGTAQSRRADTSSDTTAAMSGGVVYNGTMRPAYRWILIGPARSGSTFHKDPNCTSAWNGLLSGEKKWLLYPPDQPPPGVFPSQDGRDVVTPISVTEWFVNFYSEHTQRLKDFKKRQKKILIHSSTNTAVEKQLKEKKELESSSLSSCDCPSVNDYSDCGPIEVTCRSGDLLFIPHGWWHLALNLTPSVAVTQNYVNEQNLLNVLKFLEEEGNEILRSAFVDKLKERRPGLIELLKQKQQENEEIKSRKKRTSVRVESVESMWKRTIGDASEAPFSFSLEGEGEQPANGIDQSSGIDH